MLRRRARWSIAALVTGWLILPPAPASADEAGVVSRKAAFEQTWTVSLWTGAPAGVGYAVERTVADDWQLRATLGVPVFITGVGGSVEVVRGTRVGPVTLWLGGSVAGYASDNCSWGGCGEFVSFWGAGPLAGIQLSTGFIGRTRFVTDLGVGVAVAVERTDNLARFQPLGGLRLGVGW
jgi:hypothetical protein